MNTISITTSQNIELEYELGSIGDRVVGRIIDLVINVAYVVIVILFLSYAGNGLQGAGTVVVFLLFLPVVFYDLVSEIVLNGQSVGKKVMGIKVISLSGDQPTISQYLIRWLFRVIDFSILGGLVALILVAVTEKKQRLGDLIAGTVLIKLNPRTSLSHTMYEPVSTVEYKVTYPEASYLNDNDIQLVKEVILTVRRTGNTMLALQAQQKIEQVLHIESKSADPRSFLQTILADFNYLTSQE
jgi:uncharacterized RDD family membrane protein YckC